MAEERNVISWSQKFASLQKVLSFRPKLIVVIILFGGLTAFLEGLGLSFIWPILEVAQADDPITEADGFLNVFLKIYTFLNIPFRLEYLILGVAAAMTIRFTSSFLMAWLRAIVQMEYIESLRSSAFEAVLNAEIAYFDQEGSDEILNTIITETTYSGKVIKQGVRTLETIFLVMVYLVVMFYIAPFMTFFALLVLGGITYILRDVIEPAYTVGSRVAEANERIQEIVQAGTQGIRDVKLFRLSSKFFDRYMNWIDQYKYSSIDLERNKAAIQNFYDLAAALTLFALIYVGFVFSGLSLGELGIFLLAMFRLAPLVSRLNSDVYNVEGNLSHLVRTQNFIEEIGDRLEKCGDRPLDRISTIRFDAVDFSYGNEHVLQEISFEVQRGDFVAFVGKSGAGKSTIVSLLSRMYEPDTGSIRINGSPIQDFDLQALRRRIAVVRQDPFIFNTTLKRNITIGNRDASSEAVAKVCEIAKVDEFVSELPHGYESELGDDGVRLSGGQRQRVALARALLINADFLVLDEATSDLDSNLEKQVQEAIETMENDYGIIAIAHRLSTVENADRIYSVKNGSIVEQGTHGELIENGGEYSNLYALQSRK